MSRHVFTNRVITLRHPVLRRGRWRDVVSACRRALLTPIGLRTLAPNDPSYQPFYHGDQGSRDQAYHQGTVWPWLLGPFVTAYIRAFGDAVANRRDAREFLAGLEPHLRQAGLGGISEVADGQPPHTAGGCPWQAWSVGEPLRAMVEDCAP